MIEKNEKKKYAPFRRQFPDTTRVKEQNKKNRRSPHDSSVCAINIKLVLRILASFQFHINIPCIWRCHPYPSGENSAK